MEKILYKGTGSLRVTIKIVINQNEEIIISEIDGSDLAEAHFGSDVETYVTITSANRQLLIQKLNKNKQNFFQRLLHNNNTYKQLNLKDNNDLLDWFSTQFSNIDAIAEIEKTLKKHKIPFQKKTWPFG